MTHEASNGCQIVEGIHFRDLTAAERGKSKWKGIYLCDVLHICKTGVRRDYVCKQGGREWGRITPRGVLVRKDYAWNYCTASPDWQKPASGPHDILYQFSGCTWFPAQITRERADRIFRLFSTGLSASWYFAVLAATSWICWAKPPRAGETVELIYET